MINYTKGNLLDSKTEALVNTVNEVGVMGKGIALMFKDAFPENYKQYVAACKKGEVKVGHVFATRNDDLLGSKWIINFPTKKDWRNASQLEWIHGGLADLVRFIKENNIHSIAIPPLGCGNGGLDWPQVKKEIENSLSAIKGLETTVYIPTDEYMNAPKASGVNILNPARALIAELIRRYSLPGIACTHLEIQKLVFFLQEKIKEANLNNPFNLEFKAYIYGPYSPNLKHLLTSLDGSFLHCRKRLSDAKPSEPIMFDYARKDELEAYLQTKAFEPYNEVLETTTKMIDGFESPFGMELLSTVYWLLRFDKVQPTLDSVRKGLSTWGGNPSFAQRKQKLFDDKTLNLALDHLAANVAA